MIETMEARKIDPTWPLTTGQPRDKGRECAGVTGRIGRLMCGGRAIRPWSRYPCPVPNFRRLRASDFPYSRRTNIERATPWTKINSDTT